MLFLLTVTRYLRSTLYVWWPYSSYWNFTFFDHSSVSWESNSSVKTFSISSDNNLSPLRSDSNEETKQILILNNKRRGELCLSLLVFIVVSYLHAIVIDINTLFKTYLECIRKKTTNWILQEFFSLMSSYWNFTFFSTVVVSFVVQIIHLLRIIFHILIQWLWIHLIQSV